MYDFILGKAWTVSDTPVLNEKSYIDTTYVLALKTFVTEE